jgi:hypothetical protein
MIKKKVITLLLSFILSNIIVSLFAQDKGRIMFVTLNQSGKDKPELEILKKIRDNIKTEIPLVIETIEYSNYTSDLMKATNQKTIKLKNIRFVLKVDDIKRELPDKYVVSFSFYTIDANNLEETPVLWDNATYIAEYKNKIPYGIPDILKDINKEITYFLNNNKEINKFRPRIYVEKNSFDPTTAKGAVGLSFFNCLTRTQSKNATGINNYILYTKKNIYPENASYELYGTFIQYDLGPIKVELMLRNGEDYVTVGKFSYPRDRVGDETYTNEEYLSSLLKAIKELEPNE